LEKELWKKIKPRQYVAEGVGLFSNQKKQYDYVVKTFRSDSSDEEMAKLPYHDSIVKANVGIDIWAFGLLLYIISVLDNLCFL